MKRYLFITLAALGLLGCAENMTETNSPIKGELERSYISVTLMSDDATSRAEGEEEFEYGDAAERYVENVHFFLFKGDGSAFSVNGSSGKNYLSFTIGSNGTQPGETGNANEGPNVSDVKDKILVFDNYKGEYPAYIVAVLNWDARHIQPSYTLDNLYNTLAAIRNDNNHFVMSNAVYADMQGKVVRANALTIYNIGKSEAEAMANPVEIYVERISAKVEVEAKGDVEGMDATYDIETTVGGAPVYAKVVKWELYNDYNHSIMLKHIYPDTWGMGSEVGFLWNDPNRFRSYWAASYTGSFPNDNHFNWNDGRELSDVAYCGENTRQAVVDGEGEITSDPRSKVIIKAQLVDGAGDPVEVAIWYGHSYVGETALRTEVATLLAHELYYLDGGEYKGIGAADLALVAGGNAPEGVDAEAYEAVFQLADAALTKEWFTYSNAEGYVAVTSDAVNNRLANVEPAMVYNDGMTYYYADIRHMGRANSASEYGVVRNHIYKVNIATITGLGTPVYDPEIDIETPERPSDVNSYVAAEVRILSWKVVKNEYNVE